MMEKWLDSMLGNPIGLLGMTTIFGAIAIVAFIAIVLARKSAKKVPGRRRVASTPPGHGR